MMMDLLKKDLERWYYFAGQPDRKAGFKDVLLGAVSARSSVSHAGAIFAAVSSVKALASMPNGNWNFRAKRSSGQ